MTQPEFNKAVHKLATPAIPQALGWADEYREQYGPLIDLSQAVPNYPPPASLLSGLADQAGRVSSTGYGDIEGEPELRKAYAQLLGATYNTIIAKDNTHITAGCNQAFVATLMALADPGDTIVLSNPCYFNHEATARMLGLNIRYLQCRGANNFLPTIPDLESMIADDVKVIALVSPNNPTGAVYPEALLDNILDLCADNNIWLLLDETYRDFLPDSAQPGHQLFQREAWDNNFIQLYSFSKTFCIPGHRLGAVTAHPNVIANLAKVMDNMQICANRAAQLALAAQLPQLGDWVRSNSSLIETRATHFRQVMSACPEWEIDSMGAYFAYVRHPFGSLPSTAVVKKMAIDYGVLPLPGAFFGEQQNHHLRFAFANADIDTIGMLEDRLIAMRHMQIA